MAGSNPPPKAKRAPTPPKLPAAKGAPSRSVARDTVVNTLRTGDVYVMLDDPANADDTFHLVPSDPKSKKKEPKTERVTIAGQGVAVRFHDFVESDRFTYDLVHARAGKSRDVVQARLPGLRLPDYGAPFHGVEPGPLTPARAKPTVVREPSEEVLREKRVDVLRLTAAEPKV